MPAERAQMVADALVAAGIRGILNFAPITLRLPHNVSLITVDLAVQLETTRVSCSLSASRIAIISLAAYHRDFVAFRIVLEFIHEGADEQQASAAGFLHVLRIRRIGYLRGVKALPFIADDVTHLVG